MKGFTTLHYAALASNMNALKKLFLIPHIDIM